MGSHNPSDSIGIGVRVRRRRLRHEVGLRLERRLRGRQDGRREEVLLAHRLQPK